MSDYISKSELMDALIYCDGLGRKSLEAVIKTIEEQPTLSETEIIRKAFERVVEKVDDLETYFDNGDFATCGDRLVVLKDVLHIVKEEGGIE